MQCLDTEKNEAIAQVDFRKSETKKISSCNPNSSPAENSEKRAKCANQWLQNRNACIKDLPDMDPASRIQAPHQLEPLGG
jgi:hypothetical protein